MTKLSPPEKYRGLQVRIKEEGTKSALTKKNTWFIYRKLEKNAQDYYHVLKIAADEFV